MDSERKVINQYLYVETAYMPTAGFYTDSRNACIRSQAVSIIATIPINFYLLASSITELLIINNSLNITLPNFVIFVLISFSEYFTLTQHSPIIAPDAFIAYLAMNYFDCYFSRNQFQDVQDVKSDSEKVRLIALCCLFISTKMRIGTFSRVKYKNFTQERIMEMEINILKVLHWRMLPVTPFMFLNYYYLFVQRLGGFKCRCINEIIVQAQGENKFVCYKPSTIAMSAFLVAAKIIYPSGYNEHRYEEAEKKKVELFECVRALRDLCDRKNIKIEPQHDALIATLTDEVGDKTDLEEGSLEWEQKANSNEIVEIDEEEEQRLAKGKAVATSNEENRRLAKGKMVAVPEIFDGERQRQPPKSISEEEQEKIDRLEASIKLAMERSLGEIVNEPNPMNFDLKWPAYVPS